MKKYLFIMFLCACSSGVVAQQSVKNIIDELNTDYPGQGHVTIFEDEAIKGIVGKSMTPSRPVYVSNDGSTAYVKMRGYKIQAFAGNNQRTSKNEAYRKQAMINQAFPELETVVIFDSPFWRVRVGNFRSRDEAAAVLRELRNAFPSFGKEMYIVTDEVKVPVNQAQ
jgi:hypothetical protein